MIRFIYVVMLLIHISFVKIELYAQEIKYGEIPKNFKDHINSLILNKQYSLAEQQIIASQWKDYLQAQMILLSLYNKQQNNQKVIELSDILLLNIATQYALSKDYDLLIILNDQKITEGEVVENRKIILTYYRTVLYIAGTSNYQIGKTSDSLKYLKVLHRLNMSEQPIHPDFTVSTCSILPHLYKKSEEYKFFKEALLQCESFFREHLTDYESFKKGYESATYNLACFYAIQNEVDDAVMWLEKSVNLNRNNIQKAIADEDFDKIRDSSKYINFIEKYKSINLLESYIQ